MMPLAVLLSFCLSLSRSVSQDSWIAHIFELSITEDTREKDYVSCSFSLAFLAVFLNIISR